MLTQAAANDPLASIRSAISERDSHIIRVKDDSTGEAYDLNLSHSVPYASPVHTLKASNAEAAPSSSQGGALEQQSSSPPHLTSSEAPSAAAAAAASSSSAAGPDSTGSHTHTGSSSSTASAAGPGRRILQLPQIVSRRNNNASGAPGGASTTPAPPLPPKDGEAESIPLRPPPVPAKTHDYSKDPKPENAAAETAAAGGASALAPPGAARNKPSLERINVIIGAETGQPLNASPTEAANPYLAPARRQLSGHMAELPPSPPLEPDGFTADQLVGGPLAIGALDTKKAVAVAAAASAATGVAVAAPGWQPGFDIKAPQAPPQPRRAYTAGPVTSIGASSASVPAADKPAAREETRYASIESGRRQPSVASTRSSAYLTASDEEGDGGLPGTALAVANAGLLNTPLVDEPGHIAGASPGILANGPVRPDGGASSVAEAGASAAAGAVPSIVAPPPLRRPPRRNTTGSSGSRRPASTGSRRSSREREGFGQLGPAASPGACLPGSVSNDPLLAQTYSAAAPPAHSHPLRTGDAAFDEDIAKQAEQIRRERELKRVKQVREGEAAAAAIAAAKESATEKDGAPVVVAGGAASGGVSGLAGGGALGRRKSGRRDTQDGEPKALVGNIIGENHVNYVLMYNMLTGIRIGVSRSQAKQKGPISEADYLAKHKYTFDIVGNELTPSANYDFKFKDYAPIVFREIREFFHLDAADYLYSLTSKYILSELGSPGKSGSFFYFSRDYRFIIKTIRHGEHKFLRRILKDYHDHLKANPHTLLSRFYGLHRVKLPGGRKIHFVIMNNLFPPHRDIHETYDLKGSAIGRLYPEDKAAQKKGAVLKDLNWLGRGRELELGPIKRRQFEEQLVSDVKLLQRLSIMDYSLLIGLHDMRRGNKDNLRQDALQVFHPETGVSQVSTGNAKGVPNGDATPAAAGGPPLTPGGSSALSPQRSTSNASSGGAVTPSGGGGGAPAPTRRATMDRSGGAMSRRPSEKDPGVLRDAIRRADSRHVSATSVGASSSQSAAAAAAASSSAPSGTGSVLPVGTTKLPEEDKTSERRDVIFYQDEGGFRSTDEENNPTDWIYYFGIIDTLTLYNSVKRGEHFWKSLTANSHMISAVPPREYGERFKNFLMSVVTGGDKSRRPRMK